MKFITRSSDFFKAAIQKEWSEGQSRIVKLPEETCLDTFTHYVSFVYHDNLFTEELKVKTTTSDTCFPGNPYEQFANLFVLGERLLDKSVQNAVVREIIRISNIESTQDSSLTLPSIDIVTDMYNGTCKGSAGRRLLVDIYVATGDDTWQYEGGSPEFLSDMGTALQKAITAQTEVRDSCRGFHHLNDVAGTYPEKSAAFVLADKTLADPYQIVVMRTKSVPWD